MKACIRDFFTLPVKYVPGAVVAAFLVKKESSISRIFFTFLASVALTWFLTVPVHELLHVAGCLISGGEVDELYIQAIYGGGILKSVFPFVRVGGDYAGQLKGFDTGGSDFCYMLTVALPYLLTVFLGIPMLRLAARRGNTVLHGIGAVHTLLPLASVTGDYYEMGSIIVTRVAGLSPGSEAANLVRGDDVFLVMKSVGEQGGFPMTLLVAAGFLVGVFLIWPTWNLSFLASKIIAGKSLDNEEVGV